MLTEVNIFSQLLLATDYNFHNDPDRAKPAGSSNLQENMDPGNSQFSRLYQIAEVCSYLSSVPVPAEQAKHLTKKKDINGCPRKESAQKRKLTEDIISSTKTIEPVVRGKLSKDSAAEYKPIKLEDDLLTGPAIKCSSPVPEVKCSKDRCDLIKNNMNWKIKLPQMDFRKVEDSVILESKLNRKRPTKHTQQLSLFMEHNFALPPRKIKRYHQLQGIQQS